MAVRSSGFSVGRLSASWGVSDMTSLFEIPQTSVDSYSGAADYLGARPAAEKANLDLMRAMCGTRFRGKADDGGPPQTFSPAETSRATTSRWRPCFSAAIGPAIDGKERRVLREYALRVVDERIRAQRMEINLPLFAPSCGNIPGIRAHDIRYPGPTPTASLPVRKAASLRQSCPGPEPKQDFVRVYLTYPRSL